jgi:predicted amidophosphoribosyltransferase
MLEFLLHCLFPPVTRSGEVGTWLTDDDRSALARLRPVRVERDVLRAGGCLSLDRLVAAASYDQSAVLRRLIHLLKYDRVTALARELATLLPGPLLLLSPPAGSVLCPVPLHWTRCLQRGFNQSELLAKGIGGLARMRVCHLLARRRPTGHQALRDYDGRRRAMRDAFVCIEPPSPCVVLVDDIATSCMTLDACAAVLKQAGAVRVEALTVAKGGDGR